MGTIKHMLQRLVGTHLESWPRMLALVRTAYMRHVHSATGVSPMEMALGIGDPAIPPLSPALLAVYVSVIAGSPDAISAADFKSDRISDFDTESEGIVSAATVADILQFMPDLDTVYAIDPPDSTAILRHVESSADHRASLHSRARHSLMRAQAVHHQICSNNGMSQPSTRFVPTTTSSSPPATPKACVLRCKARPL